MPGPVSLPLHRHPATAGPAGQALTVDYALGPLGLALNYRFRGDPAAVRLPARQAAGPADGLWRHTCCEAFAAAAGAPAYREFNFSPSGQWAAYRFSDYRQRDAAAPAGELAAPTVALRADGFDLCATIPAALLPAGRRLQIGLSAVIEQADGGKTYWALAHGGEHPDFHLRPTFLVELHLP